MSHLDNDEKANHPLNERQISLFRDLRRVYRGIPGSLANSSGIFLGQKAHFDLAVGAAALPAVSPIARAQSYPSRPIRLVVPFPPGGALDAIGRPWAEKMKPVLGTVVVENIGGGGASLGAATVARARPDGYTILLGGTLPHINEALLKTRQLYDPGKDLDPITSVAVNAFVLAVHPSVPARTLKEFFPTFPTFPAAPCSASPRGKGTAIAGS
jgi:tripartite-type tricarboxylate transporter receptor subunit TctC